MTRFFTAIAVCGGLLAVGLLMFMPSTEAQNTPLPMLLAVPAPPPPNPVWRPEISTRDENFYDKKNPPSDNASTADLLEYWKTQNQFDPKYVYTADPSPKTVERLMSEIEKKPELLPELVNNFPDSPQTADFVRKIYESTDSKDKFDEQWHSSVKKWLTYHSNSFADELYNIASAATDSGGYVTNQDEVLALSRVDFDRAKPLLDRMLADSSKPISQTLARWAYYKHAMNEGDSLTADQYRRSLQQTVEDKTAGPGNRDLAMDAIVETGDFSGRDDWYLGLLEDETLHDLRVGGQTYTGLTTIINHSPNDKYVDKMIELAGSPNKIVRTAVVRNLNTMIAQGVKKPEIVRALLPWLEDPEWVKLSPNDRTQLITLLAEFEVPESVPGLVALLSERQVDDREIVSDLPSNAPVMKRSGAVTYVYPFRSAAINALMKQKNAAAAGPLRQILPFVEEYERPNLLKAILVCGGFSTNEQITALESFARNASLEENVNANMPATNGVMANFGTVLKAPPLRRDEAIYDGPITESRGPTPFDGKQFNQMLGMLVAQIEEPSEELVKTVIDRIALYETKNPKLATSLRAIIQNWKGPAINSLMLRDLRDGRSTASELVKLLAIRKQLRETQLDEVNGIRAGNATALGISACLLENSADYDAILDGDSIEAKVAVLACGRLIRAPFSVEKVAALTTANNDLLRTAAERFLISEDSAEARRIVLALHPKDVAVLGATFGFIEEGSGVELEDVKRLYASVDDLYSKFEAYMISASTSEDETEINLRRELKTDPDLLGVYAFDGNFVRIYADRAMFRWSNDPARYRERQLSGGEFDALKNYLTTQRVDELTPFLSPCDGCENKELLMIGKAGGRRVFLRADPLPPFFEGLSNIFTEFRREPAAVHYFLEKEIKGLEVLYADDSLEAITLWKNGADFRLLLQDAQVRKSQQGEVLGAGDYDGGDGEGNGEEEAPETPAAKAAREKAEREERLKERQMANEGFRWFGFAGGKLTEPVAQPDAAPFLPVIDSFAAPATNEAWKARAGGVELRVADDGLYKIQNGQMSQIRAGTYYHPIVTPNGRWAIVTKYSDPKNENFEPGIFRVNLATNREARLTLKSENNPLQAIAYIPLLGRVLLFSPYGETESELGTPSGEYFLLDPETGVAVPFNGEGAPVQQQTFRPLQPVGTSAEFVWAALPAADESVTAIGVYSLKTLVFKPLVKLPKIAFDSMTMWVEEAEQKIYIVYRGQLISIPLPKTK